VRVLGLSLGVVLVLALVVIAVRADLSVRTREAQGEPPRWQDRDRAATPFVPWLAEAE
jgi:hypothetical protein